MPSVFLASLRRAWHQAKWLHDATDPAAAELRARHLDAVLRLVPVTVLAHLGNAALVLLALRRQVPLAELLAWCAGVLVAGLVPLHSWWRWRRRAVQRARPAAVARATLHVACMAALWAMVPLLWGARAEPAQALLLAVLISGLISSGAFCMAPLLPASLAWVLVLGTGACVALLRTGEPAMTLLAIMVVIYMLVVGAGVYAAGRLFSGRLHSQREAERQGQVVGLLLRDFEEHSADVPWETDRRGRFTHVSDRLARMLGRDREQLQACRLVDMLAVHSHKGDEPSGLTALKRALTRGQPFRDLLLRVNLREGTGWWSVTAKPLLDDQAAAWAGAACSAT